MNELDKTIDDCLKKAKEYDELAILCRETQDNYVRILGTQYKPDYSTSKECTMSASKNRQLAEWLKALKEIWDSGDCNDCRNGQCEWKPKLGQLVRFNCPHYVGVANEEVNADKGVLEKINEKQDSLRATCKAWDEAISRDGYVD